MSKGIIIFLLFVLGSNVRIYGAEINEREEEWIDLYDFSEIQQRIDEDLGREYDIQFDDFIRKLMSKGISLENQTLYDTISGYIYREISANKNTMVQVITIAVLCALMTNLVQVFGQAKTAEMGFCIAYMSMLLFLLQSFLVTYQMVQDLFSSLTEFMKALLPAFALSFGFLGSTSTALAYYEILLAVIGVVELLFQKVLLPLILVYFTISLLNYLSGKSMLLRLAELLKTMIEWGMKSVSAGMIGFQLLQNLLLPYTDRFKGGVLRKAIAAIPGVGNTWSAYSDVLVGSGVLIKNAIGVAAIIILLLFCLVPFLKLIVITIMYMFTAAVVEPFSDERLVKGIDGVCAANRMLLKLLCSGILLFVISIALLCAAGLTVMR